MEAKEVLHIMKATAPATTLEDAAAFLAMCRERGLTPFTEASPILMDYDKRDGTHVHSLSVKEHYAVAERWAAQSGGYTIRLREITHEKDGSYHARIGIVSNRDYAAVGQFCARVPGVNFREELAGFMVIGEATLTADEQRKPAPKGKSWEWLVEKRARESAILQKFGREPSQSRQLYTNALTVEQRREAAEALYPAAPQSALPAPVVHTETEPIEAEIIERAETELAEPEPATVHDRWVEDAASLRKFWAWAGQQGLGREDVHEALEVESLKDYFGSKTEAISAITEWVNKQTAAEPEAAEEF